MPNLILGLLVHTESTNRTEVASLWLFPLLQLSEICLSLGNFHLIYQLVLFVFFSTASYTLFFNLQKYDPQSRWMPLMNVLGTRTSFLSTAIINPLSSACLHFCTIRLLQCEPQLCHLPTYPPDLPFWLIHRWCSINTNQSSQIGLNLLQ